MYVIQSLRCITVKFWSGSELITSRSMEFLLWYDFGLVRYACYQQIMQHLFADDRHSVSPAKSSHLSRTAVHRHLPEALAHSTIGSLFLTFRKNKPSILGILNVVDAVH